jgi:type I restriction enzyme M protein
VLFIDASKGFETGKNQNRLREEDIAHIVTTYKAFKAEAPLKDEGVVIEDKYAYRATFNEIKENDFNLNIPRYVDTFEEEEEVDIKAVQDEINLLKNQIADVESDMEKYLKELGY